MLAIWSAARNAAPGCDRGRRHPQVRCLAAHLLDAAPIEPLARCVAAACCCAVVHSGRGRDAQGLARELEARRDHRAATILGPFYHQPAVEGRRDGGVLRAGSHKNCEGEGQQHRRLAHRAIVCAKTTRGKRRGLSLTGRHVSGGTAQGRSNRRRIPADSTHLSASYSLFKIFTHADIVALADRAPCRAVHRRGGTR